MKLARRDFVKDSAVVAGTAAASALVARTACADEAPAVAAVSAGWRTAPEPIVDFADQVEADVVVVGAGIAGVCAALAAVQAGAKTVCIQKNDAVMTHGTMFGALGTRYQAEAGIELSLDQVANAHIRYNFFRPQQKVVRTVMRESGPTLEWIGDLLGINWAPQYDESAGILNEYDQPYYPVGHLGLTENGVTPAQVVAEKLAQEAENLGAQFFFSTPGVQLVQNEFGRVTGVVGQSEAGYVLFSAAKGVILATGDYANNAEMCAELCPIVNAYVYNYYSPATNTGDGHKMGVWAGAKMEVAPHTMMAHMHNAWDGTMADGKLKNFPLLWVNKRGERFMNEDSVYHLTCNALVQQPDQALYLVMDANWDEQRKASTSPNAAHARNEITEEGIQGDIDNGYCVRAETLEECAAGFDIPADVLVATVARYNELVEKGVDEDFGKRAQDLFPIAEPPFMIVRLCAPKDVTMGGLMTNEDMQVLNENDEGIEGLYAVGNTQGGYFGGPNYDIECDGFSLGRAITTGRIAGTVAAR